MSVKMNVKMNVKMTYNELNTYNEPIPPRYRNTYNSAAAPILIVPIPQRQKEIFASELEIACKLEHSAMAVLVL